MAAVTPLLLVLALSSPLSAYQGQINVTAGETVTLPCTTSAVTSESFVEWKKLEKSGDELLVFLYRSSQVDLESQEESFKNRVELKDKQMKDGDVSVILKDVTINDSGKYQCRIIQPGADTKTSNINLTVSDSDSNRGHVGLAVGLSVVGGLLVVGVVGFVVYRKYKGQTEQHSY
ncbi:myelin protein zero-like protein 2 [Anabas testudineus]|uniref:myelin protein zero-like protein 2 n=1 Tax=Anabas testudineus TaxID=64144 RepID=UPI000E454A67|nr:myelin protein zero-like protein 2 [Anabas testudineus]